MARIPVFGFFVVSFGMVLGCSPTGTETAAVPVLSLPLDSGLGLETVLVRDSIVPPDSPLLWVFLKNGGAPRQVNLHPDAFYISVETSTGQRLDPVEARSMDDFLGLMVRPVLPRGGVFGSLVSLDCVDNGYGRSGPGLGCYYGYRFETPGDYRIITDYRLEETGEEIVHLVDSLFVTVIP